MRTWNRKASSIFLGLAMAVGGISLISSGDAYASGIQAQPPNKIFAASCSTCHGAKGNGGVTWIRDADEALGEREAPDISYVDFNRDGAYNSLDVNYIKMKVRNGSNNGAMPAFGKEEITDAELGNLATALIAATDGNEATYLVPTATNPGSLVNLFILDADPWYSDDQNYDWWATDKDYDDNAASGTPNAYSSTSTDVRRVVLTSNQTLKVINTGRTWHTLTDKAHGKDSGFIGYAGNYHNAVGDLNQGSDIGYYYAEHGTDLTTVSVTTQACNRYLCKMHPYMQVEVCTDGNSPAGPEIASGTSPIGPYAGLTRAHKHPLPAPDTTGLSGTEVWVTVQSQENSGEDTQTQDPYNRDSVIGMDGTYQVINAGDWSVSFVTDANNVVAHVGNNPHNAWPSLDSATNEVVLSANWHDNTISLMDAQNKKILMERRSGGTNAHVMSMPIGTHGTGRFFITHMGGRAIQEINADDLRLGNDPNVPGRLIRGNTGPHGLWTCDDGKHILTADTFGNSATWYNIDTKKRSTAPSGGNAPLAPALFSEYPSTVCDRGFTNNALTTDVSVYDMGGTNGDVISHNTSWPTVGGQWLYKNASGNIQLRDTTVDQVAGGPFQARWAHLPIQTPVSPATATTHGRFLVTANKASFNVSITGLKADGDPWGTFTIPAGLGAHGVTYGPKEKCDTNADGVENSAFVAGTTECYYAYVTNTFEDYVSVYDLEKINVDDTNTPNDYNVNNNGVFGMQAPGTVSGITDERVYVEGGAVRAVAALDPRVAGLCDVVDLTTSGLVYDLPPSLCAALLLPAANCSGDPGGDGEAGSADYDLDLGDGSADVLHCGVGAMDSITVSEIAGGFVIDSMPVPTPVTFIAGRSLYVADLPIGVLCPDCRSGVHVGDIPLKIGTANGVGGTALAGSPTGVLSITLGTDPTGAASKYTYLKEEVYVDTQNTACALGAGDDCSGLPDSFDGTPTTAGTLNTVVTLDLELGINTGGQGIMVRDDATGKAPVKPW